MDPESRNAQLDALRCFAVLLVLWDHAGPPSSLHAWGDAGVRLFFVLSAYLITGILLRVRDASAPLRVSLRTFYQRRFLRIFPPYFVLLAVMLLLGAPTVRRDLLAHLLYLSNWRYIQVPWGGSPLGHLWSLSVEEQFYLVWPLLVLLSPRRLMPWLFGGAVLLSIVTRPLVMYLGMPTKAAMLVTSASFDALGAGALLAWHSHRYRDGEATRRRAADWCLALGVVLMAMFLCAAYVGPSMPEWAAQGTEQLASALIGVWFVQRCATGLTGGAERVLEARPLVYVGRISYGIYLVQTPVCFAFTRQYGASDLFAGSVAFFVLATACSIAVASVSWRWLEQPINRLKRHVPYPEPVSTRARTPIGLIATPPPARASG